jgi:hypothetical protein
MSLPVAMGHGAEAALAAYKAGAHPRQAVKMACELNIYCGGEVTFLPFDEDAGE